MRVAAVRERECACVALLGMHQPLLSIDALKLQPAARRVRVAHRTMFLLVGFPPPHAHGYTHGLRVVTRPPQPPPSTATLYDVIQL